LVREWKVNNQSSTKYGARYSTNLTSLSNTNVGITAIPFFEVATPSGVFGIANTSGVYTFYATLTLAMAAATAGQTIEMFADVTETGAVTITLKDGVNINGNGHTYTHSYAAGNSNTFQNISGAISCVISNLRVIRTGRANGTSTDYVFFATVNNSVFSFNGVYFTSTYGNSFYAWGAGCSHFGTLYSVAFLNAINVADSTVYNLSGESLSSGNGILLNNTSGNYLTGISSSNYGINNNGSGRVSNSFGRSTSSSGLYGGIFSNSYGISTSGAGLGAMTAYNCTGISVSGIGGDSIGGSNNSLVSSSNNAWYGFFPGYAISNSAMTSTSNAAMSTRGSIIRNCVITSSFNNAAGRAINEWFNDSVSKILNCTLLVTNAAANCIASPAGAVNMKIAGCIFDGSTTPIAANITQTVVNTEDNQGNILL
jgi:hypothetical protein